MKLRTGYIAKPHEPHHRTFGGVNEIGGAVLNPSGLWGSWLPPQTEQQDIGVEPEDCTSEGTLAAVEILARMQYGDMTVWSKRFLAYASGTTQNGNDPMAVANTLQSKGTVPETDWSNTADLKTWADFYAIPPQRLFTEALEFPAHYAFDKEWIVGANFGPPDQAALMEGLKYSPISVSGYAWEQGADGLYFTPPGAQPCHWFTITDYVENNYWVVFDSYENDIKKLRWDYVFGEAMRYSLTTNVVKLSAWETFLEWMQKILGTGDYSGERLAGESRSSLWPSVRNAFIKQHPVCAVCGSRKDLNVHHVQPFHTDPRQELNPMNLITLCRVHHEWWGHLGSWKSWNERVREDSTEWNGKIVHRP